ncbi:MAG: hypothetical protein IID41_13890 [Planctomycetes bacterium]|nr:hypothetical protein [Planctomycetota bacterium]
MNLQRGLGYEKLLTEDEVINAFGLGVRPNPLGALKWLVRTKKLSVVRIGRGIMRFRPQDISDFIERHYDQVVT